MSDFDIDELIGSSLAGDSPNDVFKEKVLQKSTNVFIQHRMLQRRMRIVGSVLVILLIATGAFICGQFSATPQGVSSKQIALQHIIDNDYNVTVSKDLVAWLDTGRFFAQLGMNERAVYAYKQASELLPGDSTGSMQTQLHNVTASKTLCSYGYSKAIEQYNSSKSGNLFGQNLEISNKILGMTISQCLGD